MTWLANKPLTTKKTGGYSVKTLILDVSSNWGHEYYVSLIRVELTLGGIVIPMVHSVDFTADATGPAGVGEPKWAFITDNTKTPFYTDYWVVAPSGDPTNQRLQANFVGLPKFDGITINNSMYIGQYTDYGVKDCKIYVTPDDIALAPKGTPVSNGTMIYDGIFRRHVDLDIPDNEILVLL